MTKNLHIVLVEDDPWFAESLERTFQSHAISLTIAAYPAQALECIDQKTPDVIVLDMLLAGSTGMVLLHELQSHDDLAQIPVVVCTTTMTATLCHELRPYGVRAVFDKTTMHPEDIARTVRSLAS